MTALRWLLPLVLAAGATAAPQDPALARAEPAQHGFDARALAAAVGPVRDAVDEDVVRGVVLMVVRGRHVVLHEALGVRDLAGDVPMRKDSLFRMASNTKAVTAAAVLALVDDGEVAVDDPIHRWFPTFDHGLAREVTVRHLATHTSGLRIPTLFLRPLMKPSAEHPGAPNLVLEVARFGEVGVEVEPGTSYSYNNPGYNTLAGLVEVVSGRPFAAFVRERFYEPLGMGDTCHHESVADHARMSAVFRRARDGGWRVGWKPGDDPDYPFVRGSGGMVSTARDFATFCRMLLEGGTWGGRRILSPEAVERATTSQSGLEAHGYGFGWRVTGPGRFEHGGSDGTWVWCDRERDLVGLVLTQSPVPELEALRQGFRRAVHAALGPVGRVAPDKDGD